MSILILINPKVDRHPSSECEKCAHETPSFCYEMGIEEFSEEVQINNVLDEMKFELFVAGMNNKSLEEIQNFFNKK